MGVVAEPLEAVSGVPARTKTGCAVSRCRCSTCRDRNGHLAWTGVLTAEVVGPRGEEVYTDRHGRIKVRFRFDRLERPPERSSCWIRVAQVWSGPGFGAMFLPRVGTEVLVHFQGGDVDRPICIGCLYDGTQVPPLALPQECTQSVIRTRSSPDGDGFNEIRFEDAKGSERFSIHAARDRSIRVGRNSDTQIVGTETKGVQGDRRLLVKGAQERTFERGSLDTYRGPHSVVVRQHSALLHVSEGNRELKVAEGNYLAEVSQGRWEQRATEQMHFVVADSAHLRLSERAIDLAAPEAICLSVGSSKLIMTRGGIRLEGETIELSAGEGKTSVCVGGSVRLETSGTVCVEGKGAVAIGSSTKSDLRGGGASLSLEGGEVKLN